MTQTKGRTTGKTIADWARNNTNLILLLVMILIGACASRAFFSRDNLMNVFRRITVNGIMAVGFTMTLLVNGFDLSIGHTLSLAAVLCVGIEKATGSAGLGVAAAMGAGIAMGLTNGLLMKLTRGGSGEAFLITLATGLVANALATWYCNGSEIYGVNAEWYQAIGQGSVLGIPICVIIWVALMVIMQILIKKTAFGKKILFTGANKKAAYLSGIDVSTMKVIAFTIAGTCAAMAAIVMSSRTTGASPNSGANGDFDAAIASIVGGNALYGGHGGMVQVFIGTVIYGLITNILNLLNVASSVQFIFKGAILLLAICLDNIKRR
ncbi:MAG: ABC transporter permease [Clostridia bacterium]|nr:ABC transporter permease [Clostridia bacterium]